MVDACNRVFPVQHCPPVAARMSAKSRSMAPQAARRADLTWALRTMFLSVVALETRVPNPIMGSQSINGTMYNLHTLSE